MSSSAHPTLRKVHQQAGRWYFVHQNKWHKLTRVEQGEEALYRALDELGQRLQTGRVERDISAWLDRFAREYIPQRLAIRTQGDYLKAIDRLKAHFGTAQPKQVKPRHVAQFLRLHGNVQANRDRAVLSSLFSYLMDLGEVDFNPCYGVRRNSEKPRTRYVTDEEFLTAYESASEPLQDAMMLAYLTGMRQGDLLSLRLTDAQEDGLHWTEGKTQRPRLVLWSDDLRFHVERCKARSRTDRLLTGLRGQPYSSSGFQTAWQRLMRGLDSRFTFHDIRAKAASDHEDGRALLSHATEGVFKRHYLRRPKGVKPTR